MNIPSRRFNNDLNLCICIHNHSASKHSDLAEYFIGYTHFQCYRSRHLSNKLNIVFANIDRIIPANFVPLKSSVTLSKYGLRKVNMNYYMTDQISRASVTMARCVKMQL